MEAFEREERLLGKLDIPHTRIMQNGWQMGHYWYFSALDCPKGLYDIYYTHVRPRFDKRVDCSSQFDQLVAAYWGPDVADFITGKLREKEMYSNQLRKRFEAGAETANDS
jgi:hypothetical protein